MSTPLSKRGVILATIVALAASTLSATPAFATPPSLPEVQKEKIVKGRSAPAAGADTGRTGTPFETRPAVWPSAKVIEVDPDAVRTSRTPDQTGPVRVLPTGKPGKKIRIETFGRDRSKSAGVNGLVFKVSGGEAKVAVDYSAFRSAFGGAWARRLRLVELPECALSIPDKVECRGKVVPSVNDVGKATITAAGTTSSSGALMAVTSGPSSDSGTFAATSLSPSATWSNGGNTGGFSWSYDMRTPPALNGPAPKLALTYSSASVDGMMVASNNQPSWVGQGFALGISYIERRYKNCGDDMGQGATNKEKTGDLCWATENASLSMDGHAGELIKDTTVENRWHLRYDDGTYIERRTGGVSNNAPDNEHWVVTTTDGTKYWFGRSAQSTLTTQVAGNNEGEPCAKATFKESFCAQAYRWNLEYVVDPHGNTMTYTYEKETNKYGRNRTSSDLVAYDRWAYLKQIDYGTREDRAETAPMQVVFDTADRCLSDCGSHDEKHWPDTPWDLECTASPCYVDSPTYWTTKRLASVTTKSGGKEVERWTFKHSFPSPGDGTDAGLWLEKISHAGLVGQSTTVPDITFVGKQLNNRVDTASDQRAAMNWWRIKEIHTETGGHIEVTYSKPDCDPASRMPDKNALHNNKLRCYPVRWTPEGKKDPELDFFHKYVVTGVTEVDRTGGAKSVVTTYDYDGDPAWHYTDDDGFIKEEDKTWSVWRGYGKVRTTKGQPGEQTLTETTYFRGMHGDKSPSGVTDVELPAISTGNVPAAKDEDSFAGMPREEITYNGPGGDEVSAKVSVPWQSAETASRTINNVTVHARHAKVAGEHTRTALDGNRPARTTSKYTTFDDVYGMATRSEDRGDDAVAGDEKCVLIDYARNTGSWKVDAVSRTRKFVTDCEKAAKNPADADHAGDDRTYFDGQEHGVPPTKGDVTKQETLKSVSGGVPSYITQVGSAFDAYGRITKVTDPKGTATTAYTPAAGGPVTKTSTTNAMNWTTTTEVEPAWNLPLAVVDANGKRTEIAYDGLGRTTAVWLYGRATDANADKRFSYLVRQDGPVVVTTETRNQNNGYITTRQLFDSLLRPRQTQTPDATGGTNAVVTDQYYDTVGRAVRKNNAYLADVAPSDSLFLPVDTIPSQTQLTFDGAGRTTKETLKRNAPFADPGGDVVLETATAYAGDRVDVTPPAGATRSSTIIDALGRTRELRQYHAGAGAGSTDPATFDSTKYTYDRQDRLDTVTAASGHVWDYDHDLRGRRVRTADPDKGVSTFTYDDADQLVSTSDARDKSLWFTYDAIGRRTSVLEGAATGTKLAEWTYDKLANGTTLNGVLVKSARYEGGNAYTKEHTAFQAQTLLPTSTTFTVPPAETGLAGKYTYNNGYYDNGSLRWTRLPKLGSVPLETLQFGYDSLGQAKSVNSSTTSTPEGTLVTDSLYTSFGELAVFRMRNDERMVVDVARTFETTTRRLEQIWTQREKGPRDVANVKYEYDPAGNVTKIADSVSGDTQCFRTDHLRRLTDAWTPSSGDCATNPSPSTPLGGPAKYWQSFGYNVAGDRVSLVERGIAPAPRTVAYTPTKGKHSLATTLTTDGAGTRVGEYSYDNVGNMLTRPTPDGTQTMTWDTEGHLATSTDAKGKTSFLYDADGTRMIRRDPGGKTLYLPGQELRVDKSGTKSATRYYTYGGQMIGARTAAGIEWMTSDRNGTAESTIADDAEQTVRTRRMMPFGDLRADRTSWHAFLDKGFVGGTVDNTGLTHLGAREYDPSTGRFVSLDPIVDHNDPQQMHGYSYSNNAPVTFTDPSGLSHSCPDNDCRNTAPTGNKGQPVRKNEFNEWWWANESHKYYTLGSDAPAGAIGSSGASAASYCNTGGYPAAQQCSGKGGRSQGSYSPQPSAYPACANCPTNSTKEKVHLIFDAMGMLPVIGEVFDVVNCIAYAQDGNIGDAAGSCGGAAPGLGNLITGAKWLKNSDEIAEVLKTGGKCVNSFSGDTLVLMADGTTKRIDQIKVGDKVANSNPESSGTQPDTVIHVHVTDEDKEYVELTVATADGPKAITTTAHHEFYNVSTHTWVNAVVLQVGQELDTPGDGRAIVQGVRPFEATMRTYNLSIEVVHTFYVLAGTTAVLVHNCGPGVKGGVENLQDGAQMATSDALDTAIEFLGPGYKDMGGGRFLSDDGLRQVRMTDADLAHKRQNPHLNFETYDQPIGPGVRGGRPKSNIHIFLPEEPGWHW